MKYVNVCTYNSNIFQAIMTFVVKNEQGNYALLLKDLCYIIGVDIQAINQMLQLNYDTLNAENIPHLELSKIETRDNWMYINNKRERKLTDDDKYLITPDNSDALSYVLLDMIRDRSIKTDYEQTFAVILGLTVKDCFKYASQFDV